jgi:hypothetical protein
MPGPHSRLSLILLASLLGGCQCSARASGDLRVDVVFDAPARPDRSPADRWRPDDNWRSAIELVWDRLVAAQAGGPSASVPIAFDGTRFARAQASDFLLFDTQATLNKKVPLPKPSMELSMVAGEKSYGAIFNGGQTDRNKYFVLVQLDGTMDLGTAVKLPYDWGVLTWSSTLANYFYHSWASQEPPQVGQWRFTAAGKPIGSGPLIVEPDASEGPLFDQAGWLGSELVVLSEGAKFPLAKGDLTYTAYVRFLSPPYTATKK